ncbi:UNVERIFIED_ORG: hypothetical protein QFZ59_000521 [Bacillus sp. B2I3]|nr:hypothetical protein [Bacillus sp. B2I3]
MKKIWLTPVWVSELEQSFFHSTSSNRVIVRSLK